MYLLKTNSYSTKTPIFQKVQDGEGMLFAPDAVTGKDYFTRGHYEEHYINWVRTNFIREDKCFIDIGAHLGAYTVELAPSAKHVYSFECSPKTFNYLCSNILLRDLSYRVTKHNVALSNTNATSPYFIRAAEDGGGNGIEQFDVDLKNNIPCIQVPTRTLDSFELTNINFIKIDVEGHEENVLKGAVKTLEENNYPKLLFESWPERCQATLGVPAKTLRKSLFEFIQSLEYKIIPVSGSWDDMFLAERV